MIIELLTVEKPIKGAKSGQPIISACMRLKIRETDRERETERERELILRGMAEGFLSCVQGRL